MQPHWVCQHCRGSVWTSACILCCWWPLHCEVHWRQSWFLSRMVWSRTGWDQITCYQDSGHNIFPRWTSEWYHPGADLEVCTGSLNHTDPHHWQEQQHCLLWDLTSGMTECPPDDRRCRSILAQTGCTHCSPGCWGDQCAEEHRKMALFHSSMVHSCWQFHHSSSCSLLPGHLCSTGDNPWEPGAQPGWTLNSRREAEWSSSSTSGQDQPHWARWRWFWSCLFRCGLQLAWGRVACWGCSGWSHFFLSHQHTCADLIRRNMMLIMVKKYVGFTEFM